MATIYKIEINAVSDWTNFTPEYIENKLKEIIEKETVLTNLNIKAKRI